VYVQGACNAMICGYNFHQQARKMEMNYNASDCCFLEYYVKYRSIKQQNFRDSELDSTCPFMYPIDRDQSGDDNLEHFNGHINHTTDMMD
jgi:hypothetical protein